MHVMGGMGRTALSSSGFSRSDVAEVPCGSPWMTESILSSADEAELALKRMHSAMTSPPKIMSHEEHSAGGKGLHVVSVLSARADQQR